MTKQKTTFERIIRKVKRDSGSAWNKQWLDANLTANDAQGPIPEEARSLQKDDFFRTVQIEMGIDSFEEMMYAESNNDAIIYPGLIAAWESEPVTVEFDGDAARFALDNPSEILGTQLNRVRHLFPACLLLDIRQFGLSPYGRNQEGLFVYPSYDNDRDHPLLLTLAISIKEGLDFPLDSRIVLRGETFSEALNVSKSERETARQRRFGDFGVSQPSLIWSLQEDVPEVSETAALALALMCSERSIVETLPGKKMRRLHVTLATENCEPTMAPAETKL